MSIATEKKIIIDYQQPRETKVITFLQYDTNIIKIIVEDNGEVADLSNITRIMVNFLRPDQKVISQVLTATNNEIIYRLTDSEMLKAGDCYAALQLFDDNERLTVAKFKVVISESIESGEAPTVEEIRLVEQLVETVNEKLRELSEVGAGAKGDKGDTGERGPQGERGLQGIQGIQGPKGDKGDTGIQGVKGADGYTPIKGVDYFDGVNGINGVDGKDGSSVTSANIVTALGYTPIKSSDITWTSVLSKPTTFTPSTHTHSYTDLTNKPTIPTLNNTVTSTSTTEAATANAVKLAWDRAEAAFTQASDNKLAIVNAVTGKGGTATSNDTFAQLSVAITNLPTGKKWANGSFANTITLSVDTIGFRPSVIIVRGKYGNADTYVLSTFVNTIIDATPANILNTYTVAASVVGMSLLNSTMVTTVDGFTLNITAISAYSGIWIAYE